MTDTCERPDCDEPGRWRWWNGMGGFGPYCDDHAREQLDDDHRRPIKRRENVSDGFVVSAGIIPHDSLLPAIRTKDAFDTYLETDGERPRQCSVSWCSNIARDCERHGDESVS